MTEDRQLVLVTVSGGVADIVEQPYTSHLDVVLIDFDDYNDNSMSLTDAEFHLQDICEYRRVLEPWAEIFPHVQRIVDDLDECENRILDQHPDAKPVSE